MSGLERIDSLSNKEFKVCKVAVIELEGKKGNYFISPDRIAFPWSTIDGENLEVEIVKCEVGKKLKLKMFVGKNSLYIHETLTVISSIRIDK